MGPGRTCRAWYFHSPGQNYTHSYADKNCCILSGKLCISQNVPLGPIRRLLLLDFIIIIFVIFQAAGGMCPPPPACLSSSVFFIAISLQVVLFIGYMVYK